MCSHAGEWKVIILEPHVQGTRVRSIRSSGNNVADAKTIGPDEALSASAVVQDVQDSSSCLFQNRLVIVVNGLSTPSSACMF